ncbi:ShlB/FhaC/HecB family hemolysin secretion/activation protein [Sporomusa termitida]|uniref:ShlB/FhaC/HecB family hemolysin secretion/activation protein n=1 Tax=Sporomusa termitida TaxID=2377 RepID=UPI0014781339|nr:ShlB/FhaC/HecB family hemolysin secretion/activation protein [Sporomusa termitida]
MTPALVLVFSAASPTFAASPNTSQVAGQVADSVKQSQPPIQPKSDISIEVNEPQREKPAPPAGPTIKVSGFRITGQSIYSEDALQELLKDAVGKELTLGELQDIAGRTVAHYFRNQGFVVATAYIPVQEIRDGIVEIAVMPGKYSGIDIRNHSRLSNAAAAKFLSGIKAGDYVKRDELERVLLLLNDIGGIKVESVLTPGKEAGTTELVVDIKDANTVTATLLASNYGNRYTGSEQSNLDINFNNATGQGDVLSIGGSYTGHGMNNFSMNYMLPYGSRGWRLGVNYSRLNYTLKEEYAPLAANGKSETYGVYGQYPFVRSRNYDLYGQIGVATRRLVDDIDLFNSSNRRKTDFVTLGLNGISRDSRGINSFDLSLVSGRLNFTGKEDIFGNNWEVTDAQGAQTAGHYTKVNVTANRYQHLKDRLNLYLSIKGQLASKNLDSSEQLYLGGANGVRAYPQGEANGDEGYILTGELRYDLPTPKFQLAAFIDSGHAGGSKNNWKGSSPSRTLSGAGLGLILNNWQEYHLRVDYAWRLSSSQATTESDKHGRWWLAGVRYF